MHGNPTELGELDVDMGREWQAAMFDTAVRADVDTTAVSYYGPTLLATGAIGAQVRALSTKHPDVDMVTLVASTDTACAVTLSTYRAGVRVGCSRTSGHSAVNDGQVAWTTAGRDVAYVLSTTAAAVPVRVATGAFLGVLAAGARDRGCRTKLTVITHPGFGNDDVSGPDVSGHADLVVTAEPAPEFFLRDPEGRFTVALSFTAFINARLAGYVAGARLPGPFRECVLGELLAACDDPGASTGALLHAAYLSAANATPPCAEHDALTALAALIPAGRRRAAVSAVHAVLSTTAGQGEVTWVNSIDAVNSALAAPTAT